MPRATRFTAAIASLVGPPFRWASRSRDFVPPRKALVLKPCCMSQVMLATPLLRALKGAYPNTQFDWAIGDWARPIISTNERVTNLIPTGQVGVPESTWSEVVAFGRELREYSYDTCFIPSSSAVLALVAWLAGIPQRVGLDVNGRGFAHTVAVRPPPDERHTGAVYLALAHALGVDTAGTRAEFFVTNRNRTGMTARLVDEVGWLGDVPLIVMHPGGGENPVRPDERVRWPVERFARLGNYLVRSFDAKVLVVGGENDRKWATAVAGLMSAEVLNLAGNITLGELGALCEVANLYVGNDAGPTHVAAAVGCPTLALYGPTDPAVSRPFARREQLTVLWKRYDEPFSWQKGVSTEEVKRAAARVLRPGA